MPSDPFPPCIYAGRWRKDAGDRFCRNPEIGGGIGIVRAEQCAACSLAGSCGPAPPKPPAVGSALRAILAWFGIKADGTCSCAWHVEEMNTRGAGWCRENARGVIADWLIEGRDNLKVAPWWARFVPRAAVRCITPMLVWLAIRRATRLPQTG